MEKVYEVKLKGWGAWAAAVYTVTTLICIVLLPFLVAIEVWAVLAHTK